jgi:hypothetical protein
VESGFDDSGWVFSDSRKAESRTIPEIFSFQSKARRHIALLCSFPVYNYMYACHANPFVCDSYENCITKMDIVYRVLPQVPFSVPIVVNPFNK